ncbi:nucleotidyltransferase-like protein [Nocardioides albertanoniae]|uniref:Nucleotidyltransferase-like protein n=1 Tax=Nocardioides albertanoniae TaxID=1175486 RepID=A0A543AC60_9ACTN|nr:nucleotidyltransferase domain-containing protein [Nocardioides albertanoniae]TQL70184.1 nucleotidyltransferase-like protein [Nocardioides albertanoniae]
MNLGQPFGGVIPGARGAALAALLRTGEPMTGRQVHGVLEGHSLGSVQEALRAWERLGVIESRAVGRAYVYRVVESHAAIAPLRALLDPLSALTEIVNASVTDDVESVILFGSVARGEATVESDIDLAVIAGGCWDQRADLQEAVTAALGNDCDVLVFTPDAFADALATGESVAADIVRDGVALVGSKPRRRYKKVS